VNDIDPVIADVYRFFIHKYDEGFRQNLKNLNLPSGHFEVVLKLSVSSHVIENEYDLAYFLRQHWI